jgi:tRNA(Ile)-lysidine synthase
MKSFEARVLEDIKNSESLLSGDKVLIAVSGGSDSIALLHTLVGLREKLKIDLTIAHLNHSARGVESDEDSDFVLDLGNSLKIETFIEKIDVASEQKSLKTSFQESARILRRKFLESTLEKIGGNKIALGHIADDQVETFLINLLRGSGLKGLGGMSNISEVYVRPLLNCFKAEILDYLKSQKLEYRFDQSNAKIDYLRNRIRLDLIPNIEKDFNPNFKENLLTTIDIIQDDDKYLTDQIATIFGEVAQNNKTKEEGLKISIPKILDYPLAIKRRLLRHAIYQVKGDLRSFSYLHIQNIIKIMENGMSGKEICLPSGLMAEIKNNFLQIYKISHTPKRIITNDTVKNLCVSLNIPGDTEISESQIKFSSHLASGKDGKFFLANPRVAELDFEKTGSKIQIRYPQMGDTFVPLGMSGSKKLKEFFIDTKTPREERNSIPILTTDSNEIIWVFGKRISNAYRVTEKTKQILHIQGEIC